MANLDLLENSIPVAPLKLAALPGSMEMAKKVDSYLVQFRKELAERRNGVSFSGYSEDSFLIDCECPRFGSGEAKGKINDPSAVPIFTSWLMSATTASLTRSAATRTTCHRMTIIRI